MKQWLKKVLPANVWSFLKRSKKAVLEFPYQIVLGIIQLLPDSFKIYIKSNIRIVRPLDNKSERILINVDSEIEYTTRIHSCAKEPEMEEWFEQYFKDGDTFYDIGANVGAYSLLAAKLFKGRVKVYSFEPSFLNFHQLSRNIAINQLQQCMFPMPFALSDVSGLSTFHYNNLVPGGALHSVDQALDFKGVDFTPVFQQAVLTFTLDEAVSYLKFSFPQHIKIDVDGNEMKILKGGQKTLKDSRLKTLIVEIDEHGSQLKEIVKLLNDSGFELKKKYKYEAGGETGPASGFYNYLFVNKVLTPRLETALVK